MILYHATPLLKGKKILKDKRIKKNIERYHQESKIVQGTTNGYVYLTQNMCLAYYYAAIQFDYLQGNNSYICIFKIEVDENDLEPDYDELKIVTGLDDSKMYSYQESLDKCDCVRLENDILLKGMKYMILPSTMNSIEPEEQVAIVREMSRKKRSRKEERLDIENKALQYWKWQQID